MACKVQITREAQREYRDIVVYLCDVLQSPVAAGSFMDEFDRQVDLLRRQPLMRSKSSVPELAAREYRSFPVGNYLVLYKFVEIRDMVVIAHIFHQSQDYARLV